VQRASGIPCALSFKGRALLANLGRVVPRERVVISAPRQIAAEQGATLAVILRCEPSSASLEGRLAPVPDPSFEARKSAHLRMTPVVKWDRLA
jgi:hypothetical protein